jgi:hypothetical protein
MSLYATYSSEEAEADSSASLLSISEDDSSGGAYETDKIEFDLSLYGSDMQIYSSGSPAKAMPSLADLYGSDSESPDSQMDIDTLGNPYTNDVKESSQGSEDLCAENLLFLPAAMVILHSK